MGSRMFLLLVLMQLIFVERSQGVLETHKQSLGVSTSMDASAVGERLKTANPINVPVQHHRLCNCTGKGGEAVATGCPCQQLDRHRNRNGRRKRLETFCQKEKNQNLRKCRRLPYHKPNKRGKTKRLRPSVPI